VARRVGAAERTELQQEPRDPGGVGGDLAQAVLVKRLERDRPRRDLGRVLERVGVERMAD
jgi:hypothetical protein